MATTDAIFRASKDAGEPLDITLELTASDLIRYTVPAGGPFVTGAPQSNTLTEGAEVLLSPLATIAADTLTNPMTAANVLLFKEVSEGGAALNDETSVAEYKVQWGGAAGGSNASSSSPYYAPDDTITLDKDGDYTFDVLPYQKTFSQEAGTMTGGTFYLKNSGGTVLQSLVFPNVRIDQNYNFRPYTGSRQTLFMPNMTAGTYRLGFTSAAGAGSGNRVSYEGYAHVIVRRASLASGTVPLEEDDFWEFSNADATPLVEANAPSVDYGFTIPKSGLMTIDVGLMAWDDDVNDDLALAVSLMEGGATKRLSRTNVGGTHTSGAYLALPNVQMRSRLVAGTNYVMRASEVAAGESDGIGIARIFIQKLGE